MSWFKEDYNFWIESEKKIVEYLNSIWFEITIPNSPTSILDFYITHNWIKVNIELKTRRCNKDDYKDTLIWANKLWEARNKFYKLWEETLFFFAYEDWLYYINPLDNIGRREYKLQRWDRGIDSKKWWLYYNVEDLIKIY